MLIFVDESGDPGFRFQKNSSRYFVVTSVVFTDNAAATAAHECIKGIRRQLGVPDHFEFHFSKASKRVRKVFFDEVAKLDFLYYSFVLNKPKLWGNGFSFKGPFYKYPVRLLFENMADILRSAKVVFDRCGDNAFRRTLKTYLKKHAGKCGDGEPRIKSVNAERSHANNLVQLADMVCGAVARSFGDKSSAGEYRFLLRDKEAMVKFWPT